MQYSESTTHNTAREWWERNTTKEQLHAAQKGYHTTPQRSGRGTPQRVGEEHHERAVVMQHRAKTTQH
jgi:hypothetical protein